MKYSRRAFLGLAVGAGIGLGYLFFNLGPDKKSEIKYFKDVTIHELNVNPKDYLEKRIRTEGYPEYIGRRTYWVPYLCINISLDIFKEPFSEIEYKTYRLHESKLGGDSITMVDHNGLDMFNDTKTGIVHDNLIRAIGAWYQDGKTKEYYLNVSSIEEIK